MKLRTLFIGIDKYVSPKIRELTAGRRDATALWALFSDTLGDGDPVLLVNEQATFAAVRAALESRLRDAEPDDVVIVAFSGHGTRDHRLVAHDTDPARLPETTMEMAELGTWFRESPARAILCILDCCFSGHAPARVFEASPVPRSLGDPLAELAGKGRLFLAASSSQEEAWELSGHGLLTEALLHVLRESPGPVDLVAAMGPIMERIRARAAALGYTQTPALYGHVDGGLSLPSLRPGPKFAAAFPETSKLHVSERVADLAGFGCPETVIREWQARFSGGLNTLQQEAVNTYRVLDGDSLLVVAPTSSGKTFIGEMASVRASLDGRKSVFLLPYRALVSEKYDQFAALYGDALGMRVIRSTGDYLDDNRQFISGQYDMALLTYEMFLRMAVTYPHILSQLGLVVLDEAQFITDPRRGIIVELLLTLLLSARDRGITPQLVALSAVIGDANGFHEWLDCRLLISTERPVPLREGVLDRAGVFEYLDETGAHQVEQLLPAGTIYQRKDKPGAQDVLVPLVRQLVGQGQKVIVFRNRKGPAEGCAQYLAAELGLPPAADALAVLPTLDLSTSSARLRTCLEGGTAFHDTNLRREERQAIERSFRDPAGPIRALASTTTLAAGINTPASTVILAEQEFVGEDGRPFTVAEYKNMAGRAGRLGFNEKGTAIVLADHEHSRSALFRRYVLGTPESLRSSFSDRDISTWLLRLFTQVPHVSRADVAGLLARTYAGYLYSRDDPGWRSRITAHVTQLVDEMIRLELLEEESGRLSLTLLGRACGNSALSFTSALRLVDLVRSTRTAGLTAEGLVALVQALPEADDLMTPMVRSKAGETQWPREASAKFGPAVVNMLQRHASDVKVYYARCKRACVLHEWINGLPIQDIENRYSSNAYSAVTYGSIVGFADGTRFWLGSAADILALLLADGTIDPQAVSVLLARIELGIPTDALPLAQIRPPLTRGECLSLIAIGIRSPAELRSGPSSELEKILPPERVATLLFSNAGEAARTSV